MGEYQGHVESCNTEDSIEYHKTNEKVKIKLLKGVLKKDEIGKPFIEYVVDINYNQHNWRILRKFNQFSNFHKQVKYVTYFWFESAFIGEVYRTLF